MANTELDELIRAVVRREAGSASPDTPALQTPTAAPQASAEVRISKTVEAAAATSPSNPGERSPTLEMDRLAAQIESLRRTVASQEEAMQENTQALAASAVKASITSTASTVTKNVVNNLGGSLGVSPIISGIVKLFSAFRSSDPEPPPLRPFVLPPALQVDAGLDSRSQAIAPVSYGQGNEVRLPLQPRVPSATVHVNINAIDSQSFMDHSADIAKAVREAMLHAHSLNDVVQEL